MGEQSGWDGSRRGNRGPQMACRVAARVEFRMHDESLAVRRAMGFGYWAIKASDLFMAGQSSASLGTAAVLVGHPNVTRISPVMPGGRFKLDGVEAVRAL